MCGQLNDLKMLTESKNKDNGLQFVINHSLRDTFRKPPPEIRRLIHLFLISPEMSAVLQHKNVF